MEALCCGIGFCATCGKEAPITIASHVATQEVEVPRNITEAMLLSHVDPETNDMCAGAFGTPQSMTLYTGEEIAV